MVRAERRVQKVQLMLWMDRTETAGKVKEKGVFEDGDRGTLRSQAGAPQCLGGKVGARVPKEG